MIQNKVTSFRLPRVGLLTGSLLILTLLILIGGCGIFEVDNPGAIMEDDLNTPIAVPALVAGAGGDLSVSIAASLASTIVYSGIFVDELQHVGSYSDWRQVDDRNEIITLDNISLNNLWGGCSRARWVADDGIRRIKDILGDGAQNSAALAEILVYAGFAHLTLGDLWGAVPFDGGPLTTEEEVYQRAIARFTEAITVGQAAGASGANWVNAAYAGRARAYYYLKNLPAAVADAQKVPANFRYELIFSENSDREKNWAYWANLTRNESSVSPEIRQLYAETHDSRIICSKKGLGGDGNREWWIQEKYIAYSSPVRLTGWQEMELIQAESKLNGGDLAGAVDHINKVRATATNTETGLTLDPRPSSSDVNEVREWIIYERRVEMFFEGRRLADCRHFGTPNIVKNSVPYFPIPQDEVDSNPNI
ncbi:RagB/SusD family nutrient uptake outer membrane protein [candidate division KSB1 bacterium]|nr:RagB/SusD family nutrient uptake outer membrane protein [candidate division KSB1 bacterium]